MIINEKEIEKKVLICYVCDKPLEVGQSYEMITTNSKKEIVVHTNCVCRKGEKNV